MRNYLAMIGIFTAALSVSASGAGAQCYVCLEPSPGIWQCAPNGSGPGWISCEVIPGLGCDVHSECTIDRLTAAEQVSPDGTVLCHESGTRAVEPNEIPSFGPVGSIRVDVGSGRVYERGCGGVVFARR